MLHIKKNQTIDRRKFLSCSLGLAVCAGLDSLQLPKSSLNQTSEEWHPGPQIELSYDKPFDLSKTLPKDFKLGGEFSIDLKNGQYLPDGLILNKSGLLIVKVNQGNIDIKNVVFTYVEPI